ncbi:hypothetical protein Baya_4838 [Bagarius yarrelli]|uniref:Uncharacterized protein n=1 Tax=Bagarius yarrelli TaxID=175774 RepID=A0A556TRQ1_BAGYA|nr:hypothetical protein Baya_4838 [Bagarius yarrelli]
MADVPGCVFAVVFLARPSKPRMKDEPEGLPTRSSGQLLDGFRSTHQQIPSAVPQSVCLSHAMISDIGVEIRLKQSRFMDIRMQIHDKRIRDRIYFRLSINKCQRIFSKSSVRVSPKPRSGLRKDPVTAEEEKTGNWSCVGIDEDEEEDEDEVTQTCLRFSRYICCAFFSISVLITASIVRDR